MLTPITLTIILRKLMLWVSNWRWKLVLKSSFTALLSFFTIQTTAETFGRPEPLEVNLTVETNLFPMFQRDQKIYAPAAITSDGVSVQNIGLRLKGHGSFQPIDQKPAFTVKPSAFQKDQTFLGMKMFHLNNCIQDPSYTSAMLGSELFRKAGVAAPKIRYARVKLNDKDLGLYVLGEATNKDFLKENFGNNKGNLYEGEGRDIDRQLDQDSGDESTNQEDLKQLALAAKETDLETRHQQLSSLLDIDHFISYIATETLIHRWDGYIVTRNNYRIYNNPTNSRFYFIPHGIDSIFYRPTSPLVPNPNGLLAKSILEIPALKVYYLKRAKELAPVLLDVEKLNNRITELDRNIFPTIKELGEDEKYTNAVNKLRYHIGWRRQFINQEIAKEQGN